MKKETYLVMISFIILAFGLTMMMREETTFGWFLFLCIGFIMSVLSLVNWHNKNR